MKRYSVILAACCAVVGMLLTMPSPAAVQNPDGTYNPILNGVVGDAKVYSASGTSTQTTVTTSCPATIGQAIMVRRGGPSLSLTGGWAVTSNVAVTDQVAITQPIIPLAAPVDLSPYSEIVWPLTFTAGTNCGWMPIAGLQILLYDSTWNTPNPNPPIVAVCQATFGPGQTFVSFDLDQVALTGRPVVAFAIRYQALQDSHGNPINTAKYSVGSVIPNSGAALTIVFGMPTATSCLYTTVAGTGSGTLTLATPLATTIPVVGGNFPASAMQLYGAEGVMFNDTPAWQALLAIVPDSGEIDIPSTCCSPLGASLILYKRQGVKLHGFGEPINANVGKGGAGFWWGGQGGAPMLYLDYSQYCSVDNLVFYAGDASMAGSCILMDMVALSNPPVGNGVSTLTSRNRIDNCLFKGPAWNPAFYAVGNSIVQGQFNGEFHRISNCRCDVGKANFPGAGSFYINGGNFNAKAVTVEFCTCTGADIGIWFKAGSGNVRDCRGTNNRIFVRYDASTEPVFVERCLPESNGAPDGCFGWFGNLSQGIVNLTGNQDKSELGLGFVYAGATTKLRLTSNYASNSQPTNLGLPLLPLLVPGSNPGKVSMYASDAQNFGRFTINISPVWTLDGN